MKPSRFRPIVAVLGILLLAYGCWILALSGDRSAPEENKNLPKPTNTLMLTPTPALVGFDSVCQAQQEIMVEGFLHVPDSVGCVADDEGEYCTVQLTDLITGSQLLVSLPVDGERNAPVPYHMVSLPIPYDETDFMVSTGDDQWVGEGNIVRLTGQVESFGYTPSEGYDCKLVDVSRVEKLERFSLADGELRQATLRGAIRDGWVEITITGDGLSRIDLKIEPKVDYNLSLEIEVGTIFLSEAAGVQNMVVRKQSFVYVTPAVEAEIELDVSCANMNKKEPGRENTFTVLSELAPQELIDLVSLAEFAFEPMRIQQFSIWTITDNPARDGYVGITAGFSAEGSGPTDDELARMKELFLLTGLDPAKYNALREE